MCSLESSCVHGKCQARRINVENGRGHVKMKTLRVTRSFLVERVFVQSHCNVHLSQHFASKTVQISAVHVSYQKQCSISARCSKNAKIRQGPGRARLCRKSLDFRYVPPRIRRVFPNPRHASTIQQVSDSGTVGNNFGRARSVLSWRHCGEFGTRSGAC